VNVNPLPHVLKTSWPALSSFPPYAPDQHLAAPILPFASLPNLKKKGDEPADFFSKDYAVDGPAPLCRVSAGNSAADPSLERTQTRT